MRTWVKYWPYGLRSITSRPVLYFAVLLLSHLLLWDVEMPWSGSWREGQSRQRPRMAALSISALPIPLLQKGDHHKRHKLRPFGDLEVSPRQLFGCFATSVVRIRRCKGHCLHSLQNERTRRMNKANEQDERTRRTNKTNEQDERTRRMNKTNEQDERTRRTNKTNEQDERETAIPLTAVGCTYLDANAL
jgi:hypothetical protein